KGAKKVVEAFKWEGLICSVEWLIYGKGMPPRHYEIINSGIKKHIQDDHSFASLNIREEENIFKETQVFKQHNSNAVVISIMDDAMEPYFQIGDYIGGIRINREDIKSYLNN